MRSGAVLMTKDGSTLPNPKGFPVDLDWWEGIVRGANRQEELDEATASLLNVLAEFQCGNFAARAVPLRESHPLAAIASELNALGATLQKQPDNPTALGHSLAAPTESGVTAVAHDLTPRPLFTDQQFVDILRLSPIGISITRRSDGRIVDANDAFVEITGYSYDELIGRTTTELELWCYPEQRQPIVETVLSVGRVSNLELQLRRKTGERVVVLGTLAAYQGGDETYFVGMVVDITARHETALALERSQRTLEAALASMNDAVFISDRQGRFIEFNEAFATFHRFESKAACAQTLAEYPAFLEVRTPDGSLAPLEQWAVPRALRGERVNNAEYHLLRTDTGEAWVGSYSFGPIRDAAGAIVGSVVVGRDVTESKCTEQALRASEARYRLVSEHGSDVIWLFDLAANRLSYVSPSIERLTGFTVAEVLQRPMGDALSPESVRMITSDLPLRVAALAAGDESKRIQTHEVDQVRKDGLTVATEVVTTLITDERGNATHIQGVSRDITARKAAQAALRESEERFRSVVDAAPDAIFIQTGGCFSYLNPAAIRLFGAERAGDLLGQPVLSRFHPDCQDRVRERIRSVNVDREAQPALDVTTVTLSGESKAVNTCAVPFRFEERDGALVFARDITERKQAEAAREEALAQLLHAQKLESIGRLAGGIAHDFNNILAVILSYTGFVLEEIAEDSPLREDLVEIQRSGERAKILTRQLLAFSRQQVLQPKVLNVNEVAEGVVRMLRSMIGEDIALTMVLAHDIDAVKIDRGQLEQVLMNLATNARDAMPEGGELTIETSNVNLTERDRAVWPSLTVGRYVMLSVRDSGCGIPESTRSRIFDPFFTTKPVGQGTGLGLSTVYGIVEQSGGAIAVESDRGEGTCMRILFPAVQEVIAPERSHTVRPKATGHQTVMVVEDSEPMQRMITRVLGSAGYVVLPAPSPAAALRLCAEHAGQIHLLLTDVVMPEMSGVELAGRVTAVRAETKVLFMSGYADDTIGRHGILEPGINFIAKPFGSIELCNKVRDVLGTYEP